MKQNKRQQPPLCYSMCSSASSPHLPNLSPVCLFLVSSKQTNKLPQNPQGTHPQTLLSVLLGCTEAEQELSSFSLQLRICLSSGSPDLVKLAKDCAHTGKAGPLWALLISQKSSFLLLPSPEKTFTAIG